MLYISKDQAQISSRRMNGEILSLTPSSLVTLFEIDLSDIIFNQGLIDGLTSDNESQRIFRFHNNINMTDTSIVWRGNIYYAAPIKAEGFEMSSRGTLPTPKLSLAVNAENATALGVFKAQLIKIGDLSGAKVTRIRTLLKYLDAVNFENNVNTTADPYAEFPRDIFYIDKKSIETKLSVEFELGSVLDVEGLKLPSRIVVSNRCVWTYRGEGCLYENKFNRVEGVHGTSSVLPLDAPPIANSSDETFTNLLPIGTKLVPKGEWKRNTSYLLGDYTWVERDGIKYYFVAKTATPFNQPPPNGSYWIADVCSKTITGCKFRWGTNSPGVINGNPHNSCLPFGGFPATSKLR